MSRFWGGFLLFMNGVAAGAGELDGPVPILLFTMTMTFATAMVLGAFAQHD